METSTIRENAGAPFPSRRHLALVGVVALSVRLGVLVFRLGGRLDLSGLTYWAYGGPDVPGWLTVAHHFAAGGGLDHRLLGFRPPLFPLSVALVYRAGGGDVAALLLQVLFSTLAVLGGTVLAWLLLNRARVAAPGRWTLVAGLLLALDPASVWAGTTLLSEPLFTLAVTLLLLHLVRHRAQARATDSLAAALWLAAAMLTRPTAIFLWVVAVAILLVPRPRRWRGAVVLAATGLLVYAGWSYRNLRVQGIATYSTHSHFTLLFYRALSAEHLATGRSVPELQVAYVQEVYRRAGDPRAQRPVRLDGPDDPGDVWDFQVAETPALWGAMGEMAREKLVRYWPWAVAGTAVGAWRMSTVTRAPPLPRWFAAPEVLYHLLLYGAALLGGWAALRGRRHELLVACAVPVLYVAAVTLASQTSAMDTRMRVPVTAPIVVLAVFGAARTLERRRTDS